MSDLIAQTLSMLQTSVDRWAAISRVDGDLLARQPAPGEWSAIRGFDPDTEGHVHGITLSASELVDQLRPMRAESLASIESLEPGDLERTGTHSQLGVVTMAELLNEWAAHDTMHIVQAERALMQAFVPGSGPWRSYFADHDVERPVAS
jgi:hypothetical protein